MITELKKLAKEFMVLSEQRDELNECDDYDGAFEVECDQRDIGYSMVDLIELADYRGHDYGLDDAVDEERDDV